MPHRSSPYPTLLLTLLVTVYAAAQPAAAQTDLLLADFEADSYGDWQVEGEAFGDGPARGTLAGQMEVRGYRGRRLVNSFAGGDRSTGRLTSPEFTIRRPWINFLVGGGAHDGETSINLLVDGQVVRTEAGPNTQPGGSEALAPASWDVSDLVGKRATIEIVDTHQGGWGHINVDHIVQSDTRAAPPRVEIAATLEVDNTHLIVPVANSGQSLLVGIYDGERLVQNFTVTLPLEDQPYWLAPYPLEQFGLQGKTIRLAPIDRKRLPAEYREAFDRIRIGTERDAYSPDDYQQPYRDQFHATTRRGWNNDPNGMVHHEGKYHLYYQHNPFGIAWGNMHWGHFESTDLVHWVERPIALFQHTVNDMAFSGGGFVDFNNSAGLGKNTLFVAFTSTGRGECLAYSTDGGLTFTELDENPVVKHAGRDPKIIWYEPEQKWVMVVYSESPTSETERIAPAEGMGHANRHFAFYESNDLRKWTRTGAFTDPDREAVFECPEMFELPIEGREGETRWILLGAQNRYFVGTFDGRAFHKESGPHGSTHGDFYAAQTFSDVPDGRRIQIGWVRTGTYLKRFPAQIVSQSFTLPHELALRDTPDGLRLSFTPVKELEALRGELLAEGSDLSQAEAEELLGQASGKLTEVVIEFDRPGRKELKVSGIDASFSGRDARVFTDRTFTEVYADGGLWYEVRWRRPENFESHETGLSAEEGTMIRSLKIYGLKSIWAARANAEGTR
jgi:fructan beta-fructosidase